MIMIDLSNVSHCITTCFTTSHHIHPLTYCSFFLLYKLYNRFHKSYTKDARVCSIVFQTIRYWVGYTWILFQITKLNVLFFKQSIYSYFVAHSINYNYLKVQLKYEYKYIKMQ